MWHPRPDYCSANQSLATALEPTFLESLKIHGPDCHLIACLCTMLPFQPRLWAGVTQRPGLGAEPGQKAGSLQPNTRPRHGQNVLRITFNFFSVRDLLDRGSERDGDGYGEVTISGTRHLLVSANLIKTL